MSNHIKHGDGGKTSAPRRGVDHKRRRDNYDAINWTKKTEEKPEKKP